MRILLDSNVVFWVMLNDPKLSRAASSAIRDPANQCLISPIAHWEMAMKISVGGYTVADDFEAMWRHVSARFNVLHLEPKHSAQLAKLPFHHRDPFDRMLVSQALSENIPIVSSDKQLDAYGIQRIW